MTDAYRLDEIDEDRIAEAIRHRLTQEMTASPTRTVRRANADRADLFRLAAHTIGCSIDDLRVAELQWIDNEIGAQLADERS